MRTPSSWYLSVTIAGIMSISVFGASETYNFKMSNTDVAYYENTATNWNFNSVDGSNNGAYLNKVNNDYIQTVDDISFKGVVTNVQVKYRCTNTSPTKRLQFTSKDGNGAWGTTVAFNVPAKSGTDVTQDFEINESDGFSGMKLTMTGSGSSGNWTVFTITFFTIDPPPSLGPIGNQIVGSDNTIDHLPVYAETDVDGETPTVFVTTAANIPAASYGVFQDGGDWFFRFSPETAGMTSGDVSFTVSASGIGGTTNVSFTVTVQEGVVKTPPVIYPIADTNVLARRTVYITFTVAEADGDQVETNAVCLSEGVAGTYGINAVTGCFTYMPDVADAALTQPIHFGIVAGDAQGTVTNYFDVTVTAGTPPVIGPIAPKTVTYDDMNEVTLALTPTEDDDITWTNVAVKAGTAEPVGEHTFSDLVFRFAPAADDIGQTFTFTASATDFDGTTNQDFNVTVGLATPVLKHCPVEDWTTTSFTADIEAAVPGATSYRLRYIHTEANGTIVTGYVDNATFPCVVSGLDTTNYIYDVCAQRGAVTSTWSNAKSINLHNYIAPTYAIPMTGAARGVYHQDFNSLITSGNAYWYDARTIPGWYAASSSGSMSDEKITASKGASGETGILSCQVDADNIPNRALGLRAATQWDDFSFGAVFTNMCKYAVTNLTVTFTALQIRRYTTISKLDFSYAHSGGFIELITSGLKWTDVDALRFTSPVQGSSAQLYPPATERLSASIPFEGANAIQPGEVIAMRWYLEAKNNYPTLGIDDLEVTWKCAYPQHTIISVR